MHNAECRMLNAIRQGGNLSLRLFSRLKRRGFLQRYGAVKKTPAGASGGPKENAYCLKVKVVVPIFCAALSLTFL